MASSEFYMTLRKRRGTSDNYSPNDDQPFYLHGSEQPPEVEKLDEIINIISDEELSDKVTLVNGSYNTNIKISNLDTNNYTIQANHLLIGSKPCKNITVKLYPNELAIYIPLNLDRTKIEDNEPKNYKDFVFTIGYSAIKHVTYYQLKGELAYISITYDKNMKSELQNHFDVDSNALQRFGMVIHVNEPSIHGEILKTYLKPNRNESRTFELKNKLSRTDIIFILSFFKKNFYHTYKICRHIFKNENELILNYETGQNFNSSIEIKVSDISRLCFSFINDTIIDFYLSYLKQEVLKPSLHDSIYIFTCYFYSILESGDDDQLLNWINGIKIKDYHYIFFPVAFKFHWILILIIQPTESRIHIENLTETVYLKYSEIQSFKIIIFDSLNNGKYFGISVLQNFKKFLMWYYKLESNATIVDVENHEVFVKQQHNSTDCGIYLLQNAEGILQEINRHEKLSIRQDYTDLTDKFIKLKRDYILKIILNKGVEQCTNSKLV